MDRPLPEEMFYYARSDTHFLLYIYDKVRNELIERSDRSDPEKDLIGYTLQKSKETSLDRYTYSTADPETGDGARGWANALQRSHASLTGEQFAVFKAVHNWRDELARRDDENPTFIMPPQVTMEIARILPTDPKALWSLLGNSSCQKAKQSVDVLFNIIAEARKAGADGPSTTDYFRSLYLENHSVAAVARRELSKEAKPELDLPPVETLRSAKSQLFGQLPVSSIWEEASTPNTIAAAGQIALPWTRFVQDAMVAASQHETELKSQDQDMIPLEEPQKAAPAPIEIDQDFTLKQGRKRKLEESEDSDTEEAAALATEEMISLDVDSAERKLSKEEKKRLKKEKRDARKAKKEAKAKKPAAVADKGGDSDDDELPFDYTKAQSILSGQRVVPVANNGEGKGRKKAFDPYAARMNAEGPKAARRVQTERPGKTMTYRK